MDGVLDGNPYIKEAEAGDDAAGDSVERKEGEMRNQEQQAVIAPEMGPGENDDDEPEVEADDDAYGELKVLQPQRNRTGLTSAGAPSGRRGGRWRSRGSLWK